MENGFSCIRQRGGFNDHPDSRDAIIALSSLSVNLLLGANPANKNCEDFEFDEETNSLIMTCALGRVPISTTSTLATATTSISAPDACVSGEVVNSTLQSTFPTLEREKQAYVCGWCLRKVFQLCRCDVCRHELQLQETGDQGSTLFLRLKQIMEAVEQGGGLIVPSARVVSLVAALEKVFYSCITDISPLTIFM